MADSTTTNYAFTKPEPGASSGSWGTKLNTDLDSIDTQIKSRQTEAAAAQATADAALPKAGGTMTGRADLKTARQLTVALGDVVTTATMDLSAGQVFTAKVTGAVAFAFSNVPATGSTICVLLKLQNGGAGAVTWPASVKHPGGVAPALTVSGFDLIAFTSFDGGTTWYSVSALALA